MKRVAVAQGFRFAGLHAGVKVQRKDLALIVSDRPARGAGVFTQNGCAAASVRRGQRLLPADDLRAVIANSGNANCLAGPQDAEHDERMARAVAEALGCTPEAVLTASTGPIGVPLPIAAVEAAVPRLVAGLGDEVFEAAEAILTTDRVIKVASRVVEVGGQGVVRLTALAKGSGMIHPNMATMLAFVCTDAECPSADLEELLSESVAATFNQISVDRDTSTNDLVLLLANGASGVRVSAQTVAFAEALTEVLEELARAIAADGEGATRLLGLQIRGAPSLEVARDLARSAVASNLFKASLYGDNSGWGRCMAAVGARAAELGLALERERLSFTLNGIGELVAGRPTGEQGSLQGPEVRVVVELGLGEASAWAWGCDLSYDYVSINAVSKSEPLETHSPGLKRRLLVEALSYIRTFAGKLAVIKYGGAAMLRDDLKDAFAEDLVLLRSAGLLPVVVHGGGPEISRVLERLGEKTRFVDGIRVTDASSMKIVEMVLTGSVNTDIVTRIHKCGGSAMGLSGKDGSLIQAQKLVRPDGAELGMVGTVKTVRVEVLHMLLGAEYIPVVSPIGVDTHGTTYNINADQVACEVAIALGAEKLLFLTDVPGILDGEEVISEITPEDLRGLLGRGVIRGGMVPKSEALLRAVENGVGSAHIIDGRVPHNLLAELFTDRGVGTWIIRR